MQSIARHVCVRVCVPIFANAQVCGRGRYVQVWACVHAHMHLQLPTRSPFLFPHPLPLQRRQTAGKVSFACPWDAPLNVCTDPLFCPAGPPMPETPDLIDPADGACISITPMQLRKNGMLKVAATYHAPSEMKHVPLTVRVPGMLQPAPAAWDVRLQGGSSRGACARGCIPVPACSPGCSHHMPRPCAPAGVPRWPAWPCA